MNKNEQNNSNQSIAGPVFRFLLCVFAASLIASGLGRIISMLIPCPAKLNPGGWNMLLGALLMMLVHNTVKVLCVIHFRLKLRSIRQDLMSEHEIIPSTPEDMQHLGIRNPAEFCFVVLSLTRADTVIDGKRYTCSVFDNPESFNLWNECFRAMFGRAPECCETGDWFECLRAELGRMDKKKYTKVTEDILRRHVRPELISKYKSMCIYSNSEMAA